MMCPDVAGAMNDFHSFHPQITHETSVLDFSCQSWRSQILWVSGELVGHQMLVGHHALVLRLR